MNDDKLRSGFLIGVVLLGALIIGGLIWAILAGPSPESPVDRGSTENNLTFKDDNDPAKGPGESKVVVRMFEDLQCPACRAAEAGVDYIMQKYANQVRFVWDDFPLTTVHPNAMAAANAARCAEEQNKFWEYRTQLYGAQSDWADLSAPTSKFIEYARNLGLNTDGFSACLAAQTYKNKIQDDMAEGEANQVDGTPTFFVNNTRFVGGMSNSDWDKVLGPLVGSTSSSKP